MFNLYSPILRSPMPTSTIEDNDCLLIRFQQGDTDARQEMIERNIPLVVKCVERMVKRHAKLRRHFDDLIGVGFLSLTTGVDAMVAAMPEHPTGYLKVIIYRALCREICQHGLIRVSQQTLNRWKHSGQLTDETMVPVIQSLNTVQDEIASGKIPTDDSLIQDNPGLENFEIMDAILQCCYSDLECEIVQLRAQNLTLEEVGQRIGRKKNTVSEILSAIQRRYDSANLS